MQFFAWLRKQRPQGKKSMPEKAASAAGSDAQAPSPISFVSPRGASCLLSPVVTEKSAFLGGNSTYVFRVANRASKQDIARDFFHQYGHKPIRVHTICLRARAVRRGKVRGHRPAWKKAYVTLPKGTTVSVYGS